MKDFFAEYKAFLYSTLVTTIILGSFLLLYTKADLHLAVNSRNSIFFDYFFKYLTHVGDALLTYILVVILLFEKYRTALFLLVANLIETIFVQGIKNLVSTMRPKRYFEEFFPDTQLHIIPDVKMHSYMSFPSGHSATAFVLFFFLAIWLAKGKPLLQVLFFVVALITAFSRVYLSQHFFVDIWAGMLFGVFSTILAYKWIMGIKSEKLDGKLSFKKK